MEEKKSAIDVEEASKYWQLLRSTVMVLRYEDSISQGTANMMMAWLDYIKPADSE